MARAKKVTKKEVEEVVMETLDAVEPVDSAMDVEPSASAADCGVVTTEEGKSNIVTLSNILSQSLKSGDAQLLETALGVSDAQVIEASLDRLPAPQVPALLEALLKRIYERPSRLKHLLPWIRGAMIVHASYIQSSDAAKKSLSLIKDLIEQRLQSRDALLSLSGRLDLILVQATRKTNNFANSEQMASVVSTPMVVYEDDGEDDGEDVADDDVLMANNVDESDENDDDDDESAEEEQSDSESD